MGLVAGLGALVVELVVRLVAGLVVGWQGWGASLFPCLSLALSCSVCLPTYLCGVFPSLHITAPPQSWL